MNAPLPAVQRNEKGQLLPGARLNPGGLPRTQIVELREKYGRRLPELFEGLFALARSPNETVRLQAIRELLDRLIGRPTQTIESQDARIDVAGLYLAALVRANQPKTAANPVEGTSQQRANGAAANVVEVKATEVQAASPEPK
jgi:hypothetical protein